MDRHEIWRAVAYDVKQLEELASDGLEPAIRVFIVGRLEPVEVADVETRRDGDYPWVRLQAFHAPDDARQEISNRYWVHVHEQLIQRVEIHFRRMQGRSPHGFTHAVTDPPETSSSE
jgi:hypothetical protein